MSRERRRKKKKITVDSVWEKDDDERARKLEDLASIN